MLIICCEDFQSTGKLLISEDIEPCPKDDELLISVKAFGINRPDILQKKGLYPAPKGASKTLGLECSGIVEKIGRGVIGIKEGDEICALTPGGAYAQKVVVNYQHCFRIPGSLSFAEAAVLPEVYMTCWANLFEHGMLKKGESVLVHGGNSGIGCAAIQLANWVGATVLCSVRTEEKKAFCEKLGCSYAINIENEDIVKSLHKNFPKGVNLVLDMMGGELTKKNLNCLAKHGRLVQIAFLKGQFVEVNLMEIMKKQLCVTGSTLRSKTTIEKKRIADLLKKNIWPEIDCGKISPCLFKEFKFSEVNEAHSYMENSLHMGKIAVTIS